MPRISQAITIMAALSLIGPLAVRAGDYAIDWSTADGGGVMHSTGGAYELSGTIGQPDAGEMSGGDYSLTGGFWFGLVPGDCDGDGDVDLGDFAELTACLEGPGGGLAQPECNCFDLDANGDIDLFDFAEFQVLFTG